MNPPWLNLSRVLSVRRGFFENKKGGDCAPPNGVSWQKTLYCTVMRFGSTFAVFGTKMLSTP